jgi:hypothetical protein
VSKLAEILTGSDRGDADALQISTPLTDDENYS